MPRLLTLNEVVRKIDKVYLATLKAAGAADTLAGAEAAGQTTLSLVSATGFVDTTRFVVNGTGGIELCQQTGAPATNDITITTPLVFDQGSGADVKEVDYNELGYLDTAGLSPGFNRTVTPVDSANSDTTLVYIDGPLSITCGFNLLSFNLPNVLASLGLVNSEAGDGLAYATAYRVGIGPASVAESIIVIRGTGVLHDGQNFEWDFLGGRMASSGNLQINKQNAAAIPFSISAPASIIRMWS